MENCTLLKALIDLNRDRLLDYKQVFVSKDFIIYASKMIEFSQMLVFVSALIQTKHFKCFIVFYTNLIDIY